MSLEEVSLLLIDDDDVDVMMVKRIFEKYKVANHIARVTNGLDALELLRSGRIASPFVVLLDLNMPRMGGLEFLRAIRSDPNLKNLVIFVLTTSQKEEDIVESYHLNVAGYFLKEKMSDAPQKIVEVLDGYWKLVVFPEHLKKD